MENKYPVFQWSIFIGGKDGEQLVVRGDDWKQFVLDVEAVKNEFINRDVPQPEPTDEPPHPAETVEPSSTSDSCVHKDYWVNEAKTEKNMGKHFKICKNCKKFLGWTDEPLSNTGK